MPKGTFIDDSRRARGPRCARYKHGFAKTPEHNAWCLMNSRCYNKNHPRYMEWGGRGITVCDEWRKDFLAFYRYLGPRPSPLHSVDRIKGDKGYEPGNVRWATKREQSANRPSFCHQITIDGMTRTASEWARISGRCRKTIVKRVQLGFTEYDIIN